MTGHEVRVQVRLDDVFNAQAAFLRFIQVYLDVTLRIHDGRNAF